MLPCHYAWRDHILLLHCHVQPGASASEWHGKHGDRIKLRIKAPAADGKANRELLRFVASEFGVGVTQVAVVAGTSARAKTIAVTSPQRLPPAALVTAAASTT